MWQLKNLFSLLWFPVGLVFVAVGWWVFLDWFFFLQDFSGVIGQGFLVFVSKYFLVSYKMLCIINKFCISVKIFYLRSMNFRKICSWNKTFSHFIQNVMYNQQMFSFLVNFIKNFHKCFVSKKTNQSWQKLFSIWLNFSNLVKFYIQIRSVGFFCKYITFEKNLLWS